MAYPKEIEQKTLDYFGFEIETPSSFEKIFGKHRNELDIPVYSS